MNLNFYSILKAYLEDNLEMTGGVHLGAPVEVPTLQGWVQPYLVIWPSVGTSLDDWLNEAVAGGPSMRGGTQFRFITTAVAGTPEVTLDAVNDLAASLTGAVISGGVVRPVLGQQSGATIQPDPDTRPARHFIPLEWETQN